MIKPGSWKYTEENIDIMLHDLNLKGIIGIINDMIDKGTRNQT